MPGQAGEGQGSALPVCTGEPAGGTTSRGVGTGPGHWQGSGAPALGESAPGCPQLLRAELSSCPKHLSVAPVATAMECWLAIV